MNARVDILRKYPERAGQVLPSLGVLASDEVLADEPEARVGA